MRRNDDGLTVVRADLCDRLDALQRVAGRLTVRDMMQGIASIRTIAAAYGLSPVVSLADARAVVSHLDLHHRRSLHCASASAGPKSQCSMSTVPLGTMQAVAKVGQRRLANA